MQWYNSDKEKIGDALCALFCSNALKFRIKCSTSGNKCTLYHVSNINENNQQSFDIWLYLSLLSWTEENLLTHYEVWALVSGSFAYTHVRSPVMTRVNKFLLFSARVFSSLHTSTRRGFYSSDKIRGTILRQHVAISSTRTTFYLSAFTSSILLFRNYLLFLGYGSSLVFVFVCFPLVFY